MTTLTEQEIFEKYELNEDALFELIDAGDILASKTLGYKEGTVKDDDEKSITGWLIRTELGFYAVIERQMDDDEIEYCEDEETAYALYEGLMVYEQSIEAEAEEVECALSKAYPLHEVSIRVPYTGKCEVYCDGLLLVDNAPLSVNDLGKKIELFEQVQAQYMAKGLKIYAIDKDSQGYDEYFQFEFEATEEEGLIFEKMKRKNLYEDSHCTLDDLEQIMDEMVAELKEAFTDSIY